MVVGFGQTRTGDRPLDPSSGCQTPRMTSDSQGDWVVSNPTADARCLGFHSTSFFRLPRYLLPAGNVVSSPTAEIATTISERTFITYEGRRPQIFGPTTGMATAITAITLAFWAAVGKERGGNHFEAAQFAGCSGEQPVSGRSQIKDFERDRINEKRFMETRNATSRLENCTCLRTRRCMLTFQGAMSSKKRLVYWYSLYTVTDD